MATSQSIAQKAKALEIKTRRMVNTLLSGEYHSAFKGTGLHFQEVREYHPGDEVRSIDWNVTARTGLPHVKVFQEERDLSVVLMVDVSGSQFFGSQLSTKMEFAAEVAGVLGFSAALNKDRVGLLLFSDRVEGFISPQKGRHSMFTVLNALFQVKPVSKKTSIGLALKRLMTLLKKKSIVFLISDFVDEGYDRALNMVAKQHDLIPIVIRDALEQEIPVSGRVWLTDSETGERVMIDTKNAKSRQAIEAHLYEKQNRLKNSFKKAGIRPIFLKTGDSYLVPLRRYFESRFLG